MTRMKRAQTKVTRVLTLANALIGCGSVNLQQVRTVMLGCGYDVHPRTLRRDLELLESLGMVGITRGPVTSSNGFRAWIFKRILDRNEAKK